MEEVRRERYAKYKGRVKRQQDVRGRQFQKVSKNDVGLSVWQEMIAG
jgi:hypothetical protein